MNREEAVELLRKACMRRHEMTYEKTKPSQGDPGGDPIITRACAAVTHDYRSITAIDDSKCNCRAKRHNEIMEEALKTITQP